MTDDLQGVESVGRRALRYWHVDGLTEIATGLVIVLLELLFWIEEAAPHAPLAQASTFRMPVLVVASALLVRRLVEIAKLRLTYRRTGAMAK